MGICDVPLRAGPHAICPYGHMPIYTYDAKSTYADTWSSEIVTHWYLFKTPAGYLPYRSIPDRNVIICPYAICPYDHMPYGHMPVWVDSMVGAWLRPIQNADGILTIPYRTIWECHHVPICHMPILNNTVGACWDLFKAPVGYLPYRTIPYGNATICPYDHIVMWSYAYNSQIRGRRKRR